MSNILLKKKKKTTRNKQKQLPAYKIISFYTKVEKITN